MKLSKITTSQEINRSIIKNLELTMRIEKQLNSPNIILPESLRDDIKKMMFTITCYDRLLEDIYDGYEDTIVS